MRVALSLLAAVTILGPACSHRTARARTYEVEVVHKSAPYRLKEGNHGSGMDSGDCTLWHTEYRWRDLNGDRKPTRPERMHVSTRCIAGQASTGQANPSAAGQTVKVEVEHDRPVEDSGALENFEMTGEGPNRAFYRGADGKRVELSGVERIQLYDNAIIIRLRDGGGRLIPVADFLGVAW